MIPPMADGAYSVGVPERDVPAYPDPRAGRRIAVILKDGQPVTGIDFALKKGVRIAETVLETNARSVEEATVGAKSSRVVNPIRYYSDKEGYFEIYMPEATTGVMLQAENDTFESVTQTDLTLTDEGIGDIVLALDQPKSATLSGTVVDSAGLGLAGMQLNLLHKTPRVFTSGGHGKADTAGRFRITMLASGEYAVIVTLEGVNGYSTADDYLRISLAEGELVENVEIVYDRGGLAIADHVVNSAGEPVRNAAIMAQVVGLGRVYPTLRVVSWSRGLRIGSTY